MYEIISSTLTTFVQYCSFLSVFMQAIAARIAMHWFEFTNMFIYYWIHANQIPWCCKMYLFHEISRYRVERLNSGVFFMVDNTYDQNSWWWCASLLRSWAIINYIHKCINDVYIYACTITDVIINVSTFLCICMVVMWNVMHNFIHM